MKGISIREEANMKKSEAEQDPNTLLEKMSQLETEMHVHGINVRYLFHVYQLVEVVSLKNIIMVEMLARVIKHEMEERYLLLSAFLIM